MQCTYTENVKWLKLHCLHDVNAIINYHHRISVFVYVHDTHTDTNNSRMQLHKHKRIYADTRTLTKQTILDMRRSFYL